MMRYFLCLCFVALVVACNNEAPNDSKAAADAEPPQQWFVTDTVIVWDCSAEAREKKRIFSPKDSVTVPQAFVNGINKTYTEINIQFDRISNDTAFVKIPDAMWLTDRVGNSGAEQYLSFAALNLLETKGVHYVHFDFVAGVHARPATWSVRDFGDWKLDPSSVQ
jgi:glutaredoxin